MVTVRDAATVMLVRDAPSGGIEVFLLRRNPASVFTPGAHVFPGGGVDLADAATRTRNRTDCDLLLDRQDAHRFWVAAARESFEEAGFLLTAPVPAHAHVAERDELNAGRLAFGEFLERHGLEVDAASMHAFAHWRTPLGAPRRYDTWFFVAAVPTDQMGTHDDAEAVASEWVSPRRALERWAADEIELILPTMRTLRALARFDTTTSLLDAVRAAEAEARAAGAPLLVVDDASGQRIALDADERTAATRGWRELEASWELDVAIEADDRAALRRGVA